jgi:hypothetical protein
MNLNAVTPKQLAAALGPAARTLLLEPGKSLSVRVLTAPNPAGVGLISLAGARIEARLPHGVAAGEELRLLVTRAGNGEIGARIERDAAPADAMQWVAGQLALSGDGDALKTALALANGAPLWLPESRAAEVRVDPDAGGERGEPDGSGEAAFVLHCPRAGAIEVRLLMVQGTITASVTAPAGEAHRAAEESLGELGAGLQAATGRPAGATVRARPVEERAPRAPAGRVDVQA